MKRLSHNDVSLRPMRDVADDYAAMGQWLSDDRVLAFYGGDEHRMDAEQARKKYRPRVVGEDPVHPCVIEAEARPVGYLQYYRVEEHWEYELEDQELDTWAIDLFIGEPELWGRGIGTQALGLIIEHLFCGLGAEQIVIDPQMDNERAVRAYEKCGFRKVKLLPEHELHDGEWHDCWLMEIRRDK
jgi:aminoglycoside 6'-N-acetyltransferase